jgi:predicted RNA methylase
LFDLVGGKLNADKISYEGIQAAVKSGTQGACVSQLFPTPASLAKRMVELAGIKPGSDILEPSAGMGSILEAITHESGLCKITAVEINPVLAKQLKVEFSRRALRFDVRCADFLKCSNTERGEAEEPYGSQKSEKAGLNYITHRAGLGFKPGEIAAEMNGDGLFLTRSGKPWNAVAVGAILKREALPVGEVRECIGTFDYVLMNPPFVRGTDIQHIIHALGFLRPGGRLIAICAGGTRQFEKLRPIVKEFDGEWTPLPEGTFTEQGTSVNTVMLALSKPQVQEESVPPAQTEEMIPSVELQQTEVREGWLF